MARKENLPNPYRKQLKVAQSLLERAEQQEASAKERMEKGYDPARMMRCDFEWGSMDCHWCEDFSECEQWIREQTDETNKLLRSALQGYREAERRLHAAICETDDPAVWQLYARAWVHVNEYEKPANDGNNDPAPEDDRPPLRLIISRGESVDASDSHDVMLTVEKGPDRIRFYRKWDGLEFVSMRDCVRELQAGIDILKDHKLRAFALEFTDEAGRKKDLQVGLMQNTYTPIILISAEGETTIRCAAEELYTCIIETPWSEVQAK